MHISDGKKPIRQQKLLLAVLTCLWTVFVHVLPTGAAALISSRSLPVESASAATFADVFGDGTEQLVLVGPDGIGVYAPPTEKGRTMWQQMSGLPALPAPATAIAVGDVTGDGVQEMAVGTAQAGAVYVLRRTGAGWAVLGQTPYTWSPIKAVHAVDLSGNGKAEIVALNDEGVVNVYGWERPVMQAKWQLPAAYGPIIELAVGDFVGDGSSQLVTAEADGRISIWRWPLDEPMWETFSWGRPTSLAVVPGRGAPDQLVVTTSERLLYRYRWDGERFVASDAPLNDARLPFNAMTPVQLPGDANTYVLAHNEEGLGLWRISAAGLSRLDTGWSEEPDWMLHVPNTETFVVGEANRRPAVWERRPSEHFVLTVDGIPRKLEDPPLYRAGQVMLSARDWSQLLGLQLLWDGERQRVTLVRGYDYVVAVVGEWDVVLPDGRRSVTIAPALENGRTYMPPEFPAWFDLDFRWNARQRVLDVRSRPGQ